MTRKHLDITRSATFGKLQYDWCYYIEETCLEGVETLSAPPSEINFGTDDTIMTVVYLIESICPTVSLAKEAIVTLMRKGECHLIVEYV